jgi:hypothetical protein
MLPFDHSRTIRLVFQSLGGGPCTNILNHRKFHKNRRRCDALHRSRNTDSYRPVPVLSSAQPVLRYLQESIFEQKI